MRTGAPFEHFHLAARRDLDRDHAGIREIAKE
jgi:hypothetical protein